LFAEIERNHMAGHTPGAEYENFFHIAVPL
jgi:hypothetical protein